jgi:ferritin-like metal-binding protein YciE
MARGAQSEELKIGFRKAPRETEGQVERLQEVFERIGKRPRGETCLAIQDILDEAQEAMETSRVRQRWMLVFWRQLRL